MITGRMITADTLHFAWQALAGYRVRSILLLVAMAFGVAAVLVLTSLGEGARRFVTSEFSALGTHLVIIIPGRSETRGVNASLFSGVTPRDLTIADARALLRHASIRRVTPVNIGSAEASWRGRKREIMVLGSSHEILKLRHWKLARGRFLPVMDWERGASVCIIGDKVRRELFGRHAAIGKWIRLGDRRFRVIGVMAPKGKSIDINIDETVFVPVASAQALLNVSSLFRILVEVNSRSQINTAIRFIKNTIQRRHQGEDDITVVTQDAVIKTFDNILGVLTYVVSGIAAISLAVAGILIMNVMLVAVSQRTAEIGLLKALGASSRQVLWLILVEAMMLSMLGATIGVVIGHLGSWAIRFIWPELMAYPPLWAVVTSVIVALLTGAVFSILPARKAARLDPVVALARR